MNFLNFTDEKMNNWKKMRIFFWGGGGFALMF